MNGPLTHSNSSELSGLLSRPKTGREWHPHLSYYVSEPTNLNPNISNILNRKQCGRLKNSLRNQLITSKIQYLSSPKSGSHYHKNIYPQITKSKNV